LTSVERRRTLFVPTASEWTAVFDNGWQGSDAAVLSVAASELRCQAIRVVAIEVSGGDRRVPSKGQRSGARIFELYGPDQTEFLNYVRTISVVKDGSRWRFDQSGTALSAEDPSWYAPRTVADRFRVEHLALLLRRLGADAFDENFYRGDAAVVERHGPTVPGCHEYELDEARGLLGL